jgi:hypothetical protein
MRLAAVVLSAAGNLPEHFLATRRLELAHLHRHALTVRRYPGIAVNHTETTHQTSAPENPCLLLNFIWVQNL